MVMAFAVAVQAGDGKTCQDKDAAACGSCKIKTAVQTSKGRPPQVLLMGQTSPRNKPKELVIPVERSAEPAAGDTQRVKSH